MPENRRKTGVPGGEATRWKPGQSGNPGGRPKRRLIDEVLHPLGTAVPGIAMANENVARSFICVFS